MRPALADDHAADPKKRRKDSGNLGGRGSPLMSASAGSGWRHGTSSLGPFFYAGASLPGHGRSGTDSSSCLFSGDSQSSTKMPPLEPPLTSAQVHYTHVYGPVCCAAGSMQARPWTSSAATNATSSTSAHASPTCVCPVPPLIHRADRTAAEEAAQVDLRHYGRAGRVVRGDRRRLWRNREDQPGDENVEVGASDELCTDAHSASSVRRPRPIPDSEDDPLTAGPGMTVELRAPPPSEDWGTEDEDYRRQPARRARCRLRGSKHPPRRGSSSHISPPHGLRCPSHCQRPRPFVRGTRPAPARLGECTKKHQTATDSCRNAAAAFDRTSGYVQLVASWSVRVCIQHL
jgi:hypothetical protein